MWHRTNESGDRQRTEPGVAGCLGSAAGGNRIAQRADRGIRPADRANRKGSLSSSGCAPTGERGRTTDCVDLMSPKLKNHSKRVALLYCVGLPDISLTSGQADR